jgi:small-conductance mechanosensitive channel
MFSPIEGFIPFLKKLTFTLVIISAVLLIRTVLEMFITGLSRATGERYNLIRITRLISNTLIVFVIIIFIFQKDPYSLLTGLGLISLVLGFALREPIASFIAWLYVIYRRPFHVGDRIQITDHRGDVVEINYLDTTVQECSGDYLGNDRKSGRLIHFPNSLILTDKIINYSGPQAPFIWNETAVQIAYTSDLQFVDDCLIKAALNDFSEKYPTMAAQSSDKWEPAVYFRINQYAWMEAVVSYPVEPFDTTGRRNRILREVLPMLNACPAKVQFPQGTSR